MEKIFNKKADEIEAAVSQVMDIARDGYEGEFDEDKIVVYLLFIKKVFEYIKRKPKRNQGTAEMLKALEFIAQTGEVFFLSGSSDRECAFLKSCFMRNEDAVIEDIIFSGYLLWTYYGIMEAGSHTLEYTKRIDKAMNRLYDASKKDGKATLSSKKCGNGKKLLLPVLIKRYLDQYVIGQEEAKRVVAMTVYRFIDHGCRTPIMLCGSTGCGKTLLFETLAHNEMLGKKLNFFTYSASDLTPNGFVGSSIEDMIEAYRRSCNGNKSWGELEHPKGVIFLDEMDKLFYKNFGSKGADVNELVLHQLLTTISGSNMINGIHTKDILFIMAGAFENIEREHEQKSIHRMGFSQVLEEREAYDLREELEKRGVSRQFLARIGTLVQMDSLDREGMRRLFLDKNNGIFTQRQRALEEDGIRLLIEDAAVEALIDRMMDSKMGARAAVSVMDSLITPFEYELYEHGYSTMLIHKGMFDGEPPVYEMPKAEQPAAAGF